MAHLHTSKREPIPRRKRKPKPNPLEHHPAFQEIKAVVLNGKMTPNEQVWIDFGPADAKATGLKWPWRTATDQLRRALRSARLDSDYRVTKYETDSPGVWIVKVVYEPPMTKQKTKAD